MRLLTAIDILGLPSKALDEWSHQLTCSWCGQDAWAISDHLQCCNPACEVQTASAEDLLAKHLGGHVQAAHYAAKRFNTTADTLAAEARAEEREVMDAWVSFCLNPPTAQAVHAINKLQSQNIGIKQSRFNAVVLDAKQMKQLVDLAKKTGASYPDAWRFEAPGVSRAFCIQTRPHTIDRIIIMNARGRREEIVWHPFSAGFCCLIGLTPSEPRLVAADIDTAMWMQQELSLAGRYEEVASVYLDDQLGDSCPRWNVQAHLLTGVPRHCEPQRDPNFFNPDDVVRLQSTIDQFPGIERSVKGLPVDSVLELQPRSRAVPWGRLRFGLLASMIPGNVTQVPPTCASIFEQTGTKEEDAVALIEMYRERNRMQLADDFELLALTRIIQRGSKEVIKETANDYRVIKGSDTSLLANFSLKIRSSVTFKHQNADRYCQAQLRCGRAVMDVLFPQTLLHDRVQSLEGELQRQLTVAEKVTEAGKMPTVIDTNKFRKAIVSHLRTQAAKARPIRGVDRLGWSEDRRTFTLPGFALTQDGVEETSTILCPSVPVLQKYQAVTAKKWSEGCPGELDQSCQDMIAILLASCARYYRYCVTRPIQIAQSSSAMTVLDKLMTAFGQTEIHSLNANNRGSNRVEGVYGYPLLAAGPRTALVGMDDTPYLHLTDQGYKMVSTPTPEDAEKAARAAQFCLKSVAEWCLETGGDAFQEQPSLVHHRSLLREGRWLIENVCSKKGEVWTGEPIEQTPFEKLLAQIPYEEAGQRMTLIDGMNLVIDIRGLERNRDAIMRETRDMGSISAIEDDKLMSPAVKLLPAISVYYGQDPDVAVVTT